MRTQIFIVDDHNILYQKKIGGKILYKSNYLEYQYNEFIVIPNCEIYKYKDITIYIMKDFYDYGNVISSYLKAKTERNIFVSDGNNWYASIMNDAHHAYVFKSLFKGNHFTSPLIDNYIETEYKKENAIEIFEEILMKYATTFESDLLNVIANDNFYKI